MHNYLVEITERLRCWITAEDEEQAIEKAEDMAGHYEDYDDAEIVEVEIIEEEEPDYDDEIYL